MIDLCGHQGRNKDISDHIIEYHETEIKKYANTIENRLDDECCSLESVLEDNAVILNLAQMHKVNYILIDNKYEINIDL